MISVITPTYAREALLPSAYRSFATQTAPDLEWIVMDDSPEPSPFMQGLDDPRVRYRHFDHRVTAGEKRNLAVEMAKGDIIVLFDDDDYYSPDYVARMAARMHEKGADIIKLSAFFVYSHVYGKFAYCDLKQRGGFCFRWSQQPMAALNISPDHPAYQTMLLGYGFSYVFKKSLWGPSKFPAVSFKSDQPFVQSAIDKGAKLAVLDDDSGMCLHVLHEQNVSACLVQYVLPEVVVNKLFPDFLAAIGKTPA